MELGKSKDEIFNKVIDKISNLDICKIAEGSNELRTKINGIDTTVRFYVEEGSVVNVDAFKGYSERIVGNLVE